MGRRWLLWVMVLPLAVGCPSSKDDDDDDDSGWQGGWQDSGATDGGGDEGAGTGGDDTGFERVAAVDISPSVFDFGTVVVGCEPVGTLTVSSIGTEPVTVSAVAVSGDFTENPGALPITLQPGERFETLITYAPSAAGSEDVRPVTFLTDVGEVEAEVRGTPSLTTATDTFTHASAGQTDILVTIDRSCSMDDDIYFLREALPTLTSELDHRGLDWRLSFVQDDNGCINGSDLYIDSSFTDGDAEQAMLEMAVHYDTYGVYAEAGFTLADAAIQASTTGSCNASLFRANASLNVVGFSDEPEQSIQPYTHYVSLFQSLKVDPADVAMHGIAGDFPSGCGAAQYGAGYYEASIATGGTFLSICDDMDTNMVDLAAGVVGGSGTRYALSDTPLDGTISVMVDGVTASGWTWNSITNEVDFPAGSPPADGALVEVTYPVDACP